MLARQLDTHPAVVVQYEDQPMHGQVDRLAIMGASLDEHLPGLVAAYREDALRAPDLYVAKNHPALWIAEALAAAFPRSQFVGIIRNPFATVASMLDHPGVLRWIEQWKELPVPNSFLGITREIAEGYDQLSLASRCALRWRAHFDELQRLQASLSHRLLVIDYDSHVADPRPGTDELTDFLALEPRLEPPSFDRARLDRWRTRLDSSEIADVGAIVGDELPPAHSPA